MTQIKNVNIVPDGSINRVHVSQGDIGRQLQFNLFDGALAYTPATGSTVKIQGTKPSGFGFSEACTWSGNVVTVDTTDEMTDEYGYIDTELVITSSDESEVLGTANFILAVERNPHPDNITDGTQITAQSLEVRIEALEAEISGGGSGLTDGAKQALLNCFAHVAWIDEDGQDYYDALEGELYPPATLTSISAVYTQSGTVYDTDSLDSLKTDLVVTAHWDDNTTSTVASSQYTLSGTLTVGTSTITVTYGGKTTTFTVVVSHTPLAYIASSGTQYIDTGLVLGYYDEVTIVLNDNGNATTDTVYWGVTENFGGTNKTTNWGPYNTAYSCRWAGGQTGQYTRTRNAKIKLSALNKSSTEKTFNVYDMNDTVLYSQDATGCSADYIPVTNTVYVFARNFNGEPRYNSTFEFYEMIIKNQGGTERMHLIPVLKDSVPCLYDTVSGTYLYNAGTGDFTYA